MKVFGGYGSGNCIHALGRDGQYLATVAEDGVVSIVSLSEPAVTCKITIPSGAVTSCQFSSTGRHLLCLYQDGRVSVVDAAGKSPSSMIEAHANNFDLSSDGRLLLTASESTVTLWDLSSGGVLAAFEGHTGRINGVSFLRLDAQAVSAGVDGTLKLWDVTNKSVAIPGGPPKHIGRVRRAAMTSDGRAGITIDASNLMIRWSLEWVAGMPSRLARK